MASYEVINDAPLAMDALVPMFESPDPAVSLASPFLTVPESTIGGIHSFAVKPNPGFDIAGVGYANAESLTQAAWRVIGFGEVAPDSVNVRFAGLAGAPIEVEIGTDVADHLTEGVYVVRPELLARKNGFFGFGRAEVTFEPDPEQETWEADVLLPVLRVHRPRRTGCTAKLTIGSGRSASADVKMEALGMGGGGGVKWTTTLSSSYLAPSRCLEVCHPAKVRTVWGRTLFNGTEISYGARVTVAEVENNIVERGIPAGVDDCNRPSATIESTQQATGIIDRRQSKKGEIQEIDQSFELQASAKVKIGIAGGKVPINLSVDLTRSTTRTMAVRTTLEAGARYMGYSPSRQGTLELCWTTK
jgi:hypothetical protein